MRYSGRKNLYRTYGFSSLFLYCFGLVCSHFLRCRRCFPCSSVQQYNRCSLVRYKLSIYSTFLLPITVPVIPFTPQTNYMYRHPIFDDAQPRPKPFDVVVRRLFYMAGVTRSMAREVTPVSVAVQTYVYLSASTRQNLQQIYSRCTVWFSRVLLPANVPGLQRAFLEGDDTGRLIANIMEGSNSSHRGHVERRTLRAFIASCTPDRQIQNVLLKLGEYVHMGHINDDTGRTSSASVDEAAD